MPNASPVVFLGNPAVLCSQEQVSTACDSAVCVGVLYDTTSRRALYNRKVGSGTLAEGEVETEEVASRVTAIVRKGTAAFVAGQLDEAVDLFTAGLKLNSKHAVLYNNRSACYLEKRMPMKALRYERV